jgi:hypothetical protein
MSRLYRDRWRDVFQSLRLTIHPREITRPR